MFKLQKPMMLAYLIFLFISAIYHIICLIFGLGFPMWERLVMAATIASYAFTRSSSDKLIARNESNKLNLLREFFEVSKKLETKMIELFSNNPNKVELLADCKETNETTSKAILKIEKEIQKNTRSSFFYDVLGFLAIFCILCFDFVYEFFLPLQDLYTLLAFFLLLFVEYIDSIKSTKFEETCESIIAKTKGALRKLKNYETKQKEDPIYNKED